MWIKLTLLTDFCSYRCALHLLWSIIVKWTSARTLQWLKVITHMTSCSLGTRQNWFNSLLKPRDEIWLAVIWTCWPAERIHHLTWHHVRGYKTSTQIRQQRGNKSVAMCFGKGSLWTFRACSSLHCICMRMSVTHQALSADRKLSLAAPLVKQHDRKSEKEKKERKKERMCPHECDIVLPDWFAHHDNRAEGGGGPGDPLAFRSGTIWRGRTVLTSVTSPLSAGQILEYQWTDSVPLAMVLKSVRLTWEALAVLCDLCWPACSLLLHSEQRGWFHRVKQHLISAHASLPPV